MLVSMEEIETEERFGNGTTVACHYGDFVGSLYSGASETRTDMNKELTLKNHLKEARLRTHISQEELSKLVGVSRQTICSIENGQFNPTAKLALLICIALEWKFEDLFYFE